MTADNPTNKRTIPSVSIITGRTGASSKADAWGMRPMQQRAYARRGEQYMLLKSPPASGKSRALMFIALDKLHNQGLKQALIVVPERSIGGSFADEKLTAHGFWADWTVKPQWNLCNVPGVDEPRVAQSKVKAVGEFLASDDQVLVCTHATFRFAVDELGVEAFDGRLIAVDEFHHVSSNPDNRLGSQLGQFITRDKAHIVAMTGSYFRGDAEAVLAPQDEARFETVTYTYYEQLNGYEYLKSLDIGYFFYTGRYLDAIMKVLDPSLKTIVHIPNVNARESLKDKHKEVEEIMDALGAWKGVDPVTGFHLIELRGNQAKGRIVKVADLVDDSDSLKRSKVLAALKDPAQRNNRDHVDIIIALGMAKEGFDWIWCEHALTIGYRSSLTEIVQIIGRATRDAPGKERTRFTNLIAEPDATEAAVVDAINDTLKAIAASLLMEQVLAPRFEFTPKNAGAREGFDYGPSGYVQGGANLGVNGESGQLHFEINGLMEPTSPEASRICREDLNEVITAFVQDKTALERGLFDRDNTVPEELTQLRMGKIVRERYPELSEADQEAVRQHAVAALNVTQRAKQLSTSGDGQPGIANMSLIDGVRRFAMDVRDLDIDLIDRINPFDAAYAVLAKAMDEKTLRQVQASIAAKRVSIPYDEARALAQRALQFKRERNRLPDINSQDAWEKRMAEGVAVFARYRARSRRKLSSIVLYEGNAGMTDFSDDELLAELGVSIERPKAGGRTPREERIIAGFEDIQRFVEASGRAPQHGEGLDIFERLYAVRLDRLRAMLEARDLLAGLDAHGLLSEPTSFNGPQPEALDDEALLEQLEVGATDEDDISLLKHVSSREERRAAEEIANRSACQDFERFKPLFEQAESDLQAGLRQTRPFGTDASIATGSFFILGGQLVYVSEIGETIKAPNGKSDARLRVIYSNGTESNLLRRSLQRALYKDDAGRRLTEPNAGPLFSENWDEDDIESGTIYVLRSLSKHPFVAEYRELIHKIGVTGGKVDARIANAAHDATYLLAEVEVVASYKLADINRTKLENLFHRIFAPAQLDLTIDDRFGHPVRPHEWFLVPLHVIDEAVERIRDGSITDVVYDPKSARLVEK